MLEKMREYFDSQEELREQVSDLSRKVIRASARAIAAMHRGDRILAKKALTRARDTLAKLTKAIKSDPTWAGSGMVRSAEREYCEAKLVQGLLEKGRILEPGELKIPYRPYLAALADVAGELRRLILDLMRRDKVGEAERALERMEEIYGLLMELDYPDAVLPGMKRRQDLVRGLLEKTRGDLTIALRQQRLERALERVKRAR